MEDTGSVVCVVLRIKKNNLNVKIISIKFKSNNDL